MPKYTKGAFKPPYEPILSKEAIAKLEEVVTGQRVAEIGSGKSTIWLAERARILWSVEHDSDWYFNVSRVLEPRPTLHYLYVEAPALPVALSKKGMFDVVIVDCYDKYRNPAVKIMSEKVKPGGWMVLDDVERPMYRSSLEFLADWQGEIVTGIKRHPIHGRKYETSCGFWRK
jgi:predicted O-methyltransferase YrrM